jgi:hypothetical protein
MPFAAAGFRHAPGCLIQIPPGCNLIDWDRVLDGRSDPVSSSTTVLVTDAGKHFRFTKYLLK